MPTIVELGCKTDDNYEKVLNALDTIEKELIRIPIVDAHGSRSGWAILHTHNWIPFTLFTPFQDKFVRFNGITFTII